MIQGLGLLSGARATVSFEGRWGLGLQEERRSPKLQPAPCPTCCPQPISYPELQLRTGATAS